MKTINYGDCTNCTDPEKTLFCVSYSDQTKACFKTKAEAIKYIENELNDPNAEDYLFSIFKAKPLK